jgi:hypothetical protein
MRRDARWNGSSTAIQLGDARAPCVPCARLLVTIVLAAQAGVAGAVATPSPRVAAAMPASEAQSLEDTTAAGTPVANVSRAPQRSRARASSLEWVDDVSRRLDVLAEHAASTAVRLYGRRHEPGATTGRQTTTGATDDELAGHDAEVAP